jgi:hypothetical protein
MNWQVVGESSSLAAAIVAPTGSAPIATAAAAAAAAAATAAATATATTAATTFMTVIPAAETPVATTATASSAAAAVSATAAAAECLEEIGDFAAGFHEHVVEGPGNVGVLLVDEGSRTTLSRKS